MDDIDARLLTLLQADSSVSNAELAHQVGLSAAGVHKRIRRLRSQGTILSFGAQVDRKRLGLDLLCFITLKLESNSLQSYERFASVVNDLPNVLECYEVTGNDDVLLKVAVRNIEHLRSFLHLLSSELVPYSHIQTTIVLHDLKVTGSLPVTSDVEGSALEEGVPA